MDARSARAVLVFAALAAGCGGQDVNAGRAMGTLSGTVAIGGKKLAAGTAVTFQHVQTGQLFVGLTDAAGAFEVNKPTTQMPAGRYDVAVQPFATEDRSRAAAQSALGDAPAAAPERPVFEIPAKYMNAAQSGLGFELQPGPNQRVIDLKP